MVSKLKFKDLEALLLDLLGSGFLVDLEAVVDLLVLSLQNLNLVLFVLVAHLFSLDLLLQTLNEFVQLVFFVVKFVL